MADATTAADTPDIATVRALLGRTIRTTLSDARTVTGRFECLDANNNLLLGDAEETSTRSADREAVRTLGLTMVPGAHLVKVEVVEADMEAAAGGAALGAVAEEER